MRFNTHEPHRHADTGAADHQPVAADVARVEAVGRRLRRVLDTTCRADLADGRFRRLLDEGAPPAPGPLQ